MISTKTKVYGLEETLRELRKIEPEYVKAFRKKARQNAAEAVTSAKKEFDHARQGWRSGASPLVNMDTGFLIKDRGIVWNAKKARAGIKFKLGGPAKRTRTKGKPYRMFSIIEKDAAGAVYDMAGKRMSNPNKPFEETLALFDRPHRRAQRDYPMTGPSRFMWPGIEFYLPQLEDRMIALVRELEHKINRQIRFVKPRKTA